MTPKTSVPSNFAKSLPYILATGGLSALISTGLNVHAVQRDKADPAASVALDMAFFCFTMSGIIYQASIEGIKHPRTVARILAFTCVISASTLDILRAAGNETLIALPTANFVVMGLAFAALSMLRLQPGAARSISSVTANFLGSLAMLGGFTLSLLGGLGLSQNAALAKNGEYGPIALAAAFSMLATIDYTNAWTRPVYNNTLGHLAIALGSCAIPLALSALSMAATVDPLMFSTLLGAGAFCFASMEALMFLAMLKDMAMRTAPETTGEAPNAPLLQNNGAAAMPAEALIPDSSNEKAAPATVITRSTADTVADLFRNLRWSATAQEPGAVM